MSIWSNTGHISRGDTDMSDETNFETILVDIDNAPSIRFAGKLIASAKSSCESASGDYSGQNGRWTELYLYKTASGKYVCEQIGRTKWEGEKERRSGKVCESLDEVKEYFGHRWLAKELYEKAGIEDVIDI